MKDYLKKERSKNSRELKVHGSHFGSNMQIFRNEFHQFFHFILG